MASLMAGSPTSHRNNARETPATAPASAPIFKKAFKGLLPSSRGELVRSTGGYARWISQERLVSVAGDAHEVAGVVEKLMQHGGAAGQHGLVGHGEGVQRHDGYGGDEPGPNWNPD